MQTSKPYFEQIPVETVKKIANVDIHREQTKTNSDWRTLADKVQRETDPGKIIGLVQNLIAKLEEEEIEKHRPRKVDLK